MSLFSFWINFPVVYLQWENNHRKLVFVQTFPPLLAAPASARPSRSAYDDAAPDLYARERYPPAREEPPRRGYPERDRYVQLR